jgi:energy-coupling factor transporter ATP-binding protein EcfA2
MSLSEHFNVEYEVARKVSSKIIKKLQERKRGPMKQKSEPRNYDPLKQDYGKKYRDDLSKSGTMEYIEDFKGAVAEKEVFLASSSLNDHYITKYVDYRYQAGLDTETVKENLVTEPHQWTNYIRNNYEGYQKIEFGSTTGMVINNETLNFIDYSVNSNSVEVRLYGDKEFVKTEYDVLKDNFTIAKCHIEWVYSGDGSSVTIPLLAEKLPVSEMYPFLKNETIEDYYDRYLDSSASILLLIGPPGTGKTTFIRGLLHHASKNAVVTYDDKILERDYIFARFLEDDSGVMVIEDADNFLKPRSDGNTMMHRFLNVGDGLISIRGKKLIFSTNLPSIRDVDSALVRPGRCFDVVSFDNYNLEQAQKLAKKLGVSFEKKENDKDTYSLAEIFFKQKNSSPKQVKKMGFV